MNYDEAIDFWFQRVNFERRAPQPADLKLDRMNAMLDCLGNPHRTFPIVHIAGSKGKGSTAAMLSSVLIQAGYRTGLFTSPHLTCVEERVQIDGAHMNRDDLAALMGEIRFAMNRTEFGEDAFTFFEIVTALGFLHFARQGVDIAVIEVGLGGRFDSTNVCDPVLSIITSISFDHVAQLGSTLAKIAREKAGIIKPQRPVVSGVTQQRARAVVEETCRERDSKLLQIGRDFRFRHYPSCLSEHESRMPRVSVEFESKLWQRVEIGLLGEHQAANAGLVIASVEELRKQEYAIADDAVRDGLQAVHWPARLEVVNKRPWTVLDCAHNKASARALIKTLKTSFEAFSRQDNSRFLVFAGSREKDLKAMLHLLAREFSHVYLTAFANNPRCVPPRQLVELLPDGVSFSIHRDSQLAWKAVQTNAKEDDLICVTGSVFLAGELGDSIKRVRTAVMSGVRET